MDDVKISDLTLICVLSLYGITASAIEPDEANKKRINFFFQKTDELLRIMNDFNLGKSMVEPRKFANELRHFRSMTNSYLEE